MFHDFPSLSPFKNLQPADQRVLDKFPKRIPCGFHQLKVKIEIQFKQDVSERWEAQKFSEEKLGLLRDFLKNHARLIHLEDG
jgi:hypothetical protein